jgi:chromate transporter
MVVGLGIAYKLFGGLPWMQAVFYGVGPAVIGIITLSSYRLMIKTVSKLELKAIRNNWMLWVIYLIGLAITVVTQSEEVLLFILAGLIYMIAKAPPRWMISPKSTMSLLLFTGIGFWDYEPGVLGKMSLFF